MTGEVLQTRSGGPLELSPSVRSLITAALAAAPPVYGSHAARVQVAHDAFELYADVRQWHPASESARRSLRLACGAALFNLRLAVAALGRGPVTGLLPDLERTELLAVVRLATEAPRSSEWRRLYAVLSGSAPRRCDVPASIPASIGHVLRRAAQLEGAWVTVLDAGAWDTRLRELFDNPGTQPPGAVDGFAVISSFHDLPVGQLRAGQAIQRVALTAAACGLSPTFLPTPLAATRARAELCRELGPGLYPQTMLALHTRRETP
jgi:hypothetical protein